MHLNILKRQLIVFPKENEIYNIYDPDYIYAEDYNMYIKLIGEGCRISNMKEIVLNCRITKSQITHIKRKEMIECINKVSAKYVSYVLNLMSEHDNRKLSFFSSLVELYDNEVISFELLREVAYVFFNNLLKYNEIG